VKKTATKDEIKKAYRKMSLQFHPDRVPEDQRAAAEKKFKEINLAKNILSDDKKRQQFDSGVNPEDMENGAGG